MTADNRNQMPLDVVWKQETVLIFLLLLLFLRHSFFSELSLKTNESKKGMGQRNTAGLMIMSCLLEKYANNNKGALVSKTVEINPERH